MSINSFRFIELCLVLSLRTLQDISISYPINFIRWNFFWYCPSSKDQGLKLSGILNTWVITQIFSKFSSFIHHLNHSEFFQNHHLENILTSLHSIFIDFNILNQLFTWFITGFILSPICQTHMNNVSKSLFNMSFTY